jgi:hypothetical protein
MGVLTTVDASYNGGVWNYEIAPQAMTRHQASGKY